ncbi:hypothetical protein [uncultured Nitrospira sp.]|uniref:hypothetical protein n=1 Tax=uncultured Nitrospira sp. TaxID=157176 RepID=UPI003140AD07
MTFQSDQKVGQSLTAGALITISTAKTVDHCPLWLVKPDRTPRTIVGFAHYLLNLFLSNRLKGPMFREILRNRTTRVFIEPAFSVRIGMSKKEVDLQSLSNGLMMSEFFPIIRSYRVERKTQRHQ